MPPRVDHFRFGFIENGRNHVELEKVLSLHIKGAPGDADHFNTDYKFRIQKMRTKS